MLSIVLWVVWWPTICIASAIGLVHLFGLSIPKAVRGNDDGPSHIPLIGEVAGLVAVVSLPGDAGAAFRLATFGMCLVWFLDYTARGVCAFRQWLGTKRR